jgi:hypothetical protein
MNLPIYCLSYNLSISQPDEERKESSKKKTSKQKGGKRKKKDDTTTSSPKKKKRVHLPRKDSSTEVLLIGFLMCHLRN